MLQKIKSKPAKWLSIAVSSSLLFTVTACGTNSSVSNSAQSQSAQYSKNVPLRIGYLNVMDDAQTLLANDAGIYKKNGVDATLTEFKSGTDMIKAIVGGQLDAGVLGFTNALTWVDKGANLKIVGGAQMGYHSLLVRNNSNINTVADLKGHSLSTQQIGSTADIELNGVVLKNAGLTRDDVNMQYVSPAISIQALAAGKTDAAFVFQPYDSIARLTEPVKSIYEIGKQWQSPCMVVITSGNVLQNNRAAINKMLDAQKEAIEMMQKQPQEAAKYLTPHFIKTETLKTYTGKTVQATKVIQDSIQSQTFNWAITPDQVSRMQEMTDMMVQQKILKKPFDIKKVLDLSWQEENQK